LTGNIGWKIVAHLKNWTNSGSIYRQ